MTATTPGAAPQLPTPSAFALELPLQTFHYAATGPERGAVLLAHGFGEHVGRYGLLVAALTAAGYSVYAYDQRAHGLSIGPGRGRAVVSVTTLVQDHLTVRGALRSLVTAPLYAFGHSMGGLVTAASVVQDPRGLAGVILSSPALLVGVNEPAWLKTVGRVMARVAPGLGVVALAEGALSRHDDVHASYRSDPLVHQGKVPAIMAASMLAVSEGLWAQVPRWTLPTLLLHGDADRLTDIEGSRRFYREIASADKTLREEPGGYHELFNDTVQEEIRADTLKWLTTQTA